jgi:hypothetical protein
MMRAMASAVVMELLSIRTRARRVRRAEAVELHHVIPGQRRRGPPGDD